MEIIHSVNLVYARDRKSHSPVSFSKIPPLTDASADEYIFKSPSEFCALVPEHEKTTLLLPSNPPQHLFPTRQSKIPDHCIMSTMSIRIEDLEAPLPMYSDASTMAATPNMSASGTPMPSVCLDLASEAVELYISDGRHSFNYGNMRTTDAMIDDTQVLARQTTVTELECSKVVDADDPWRWESPAQLIAGRLSDAVGGTMATQRWSHASVLCPRGVVHLRQSVAHTDPSLVSVVAGCRRVSQSDRRNSQCLNDNDNKLTQPTPGDDVIHDFYEWEHSFAAET